MTHQESLYERPEPMNGQAGVVKPRLGFATLSLSNFWKFHLAIWLAYGIGTFPIHFTSLYFYSFRWHGSVGDVVVFRALSVMFALLVSAGMRKCYRGVLTPACGWLRRLVVIVGLSLPAALLSVLFDELMFAHLGEFNPDPAKSLGLFLHLSQFMIHLSLYIGWSILYLVVRRWHADREMQRHFLEMENEKIKIELRMLRAQIQPHFLYNALNTIACEADGNPRLEKVVENMANYLRYGLDQRADATVGIGDEMDAVAHYLNVEKERYGDSLEVEIGVDPAARHVSTAGVFIQPLVENSLKYGRFTSIGTLRLKLSVELVGADLVVTVANSGTWVVKAAGAPYRSTGVGLENLERRLALLHPGRHSLDITAADGWVVARLVLREVASAK